MVMIHSQGTPFVSISLMTEMEQIPKPDQQPETDAVFSRRSGGHRACVNISHRRAIRKVKILKLPLDVFNQNIYGHYILRALGHIASQTFLSTNRIMPAPTTTRKNKGKGRAEPEKATAAMPLGKQLAHTGTVITVHEGLHKLTSRQSYPGPSSG